jgi:hypothetical protein
LEKATGRRLHYYTVHGTARLLARLIWRRKLWEARAQVPRGFPLKSFYEFPTIGLDVVCYEKSLAQAMKIAAASVAKGDVLHVHPEWLFQRGTINHRGPFYKVLRQVLEVDKELETLATRKKVFAKIARYAGLEEYKRDCVPTERFLEKLAERRFDVFTFLERGWCCPIRYPSETWLKTGDNIGLLSVTSYSDWWENIGKKTRNMVRKAEKGGVRTDVVEPDEKIAEGIWRIYNETPTRQERAFPYYGISLDTVTRGVLSAQNDTFIVAFFQGEVAGFIQLAHGDKIAIISQIVSLQKYSDKAINNGLIAKAVEVCASKQVGWLMYGRMGNHPSLDDFKMNNGFTKFLLTRFHVPITMKGTIVTRLGLTRDIKDALPQRMKYLLFPVYNWVSRNKVRIKLRS